MALASSRGSELVQSRRQTVDEIEQIAVGRKMRDAEDGRLWVSVDGNDEFGPRHALQMLWSARDPKRKVKLWPHLLTRFTHLTRLGQPAVVDNWTASCDLRAEKAGELAGEVNALLVADPPADADDTLRRGEIDVAGQLVGAISSMSSTLPNSRAEPTSSVDIRLESSGIDGASA